MASKSGSSLVMIWEFAVASPITFSVVPSYARVHPSAPALAVAPVPLEDEHAASARASRPAVAAGRIALEALVDMVLLCVGQR